MPASKLPLVRTIAVELAAMKNRGLFVVINRATPDHIAGLRHMFGTEITEENYKALSEWHIALVVGECLTKKGAENHAKRQRESGYEAEVFFYSAEEIRKSL